MIIQLIYWKSICRRAAGKGCVARRHQEHSAEERRAFERSLRRLRGSRFIRYG